MKGDARSTTGLASPFYLTRDTANDCFSIVDYVLDFGLERRSSSISVVPQSVEVEHKRRASKSFLAASLKGLVVLPFEMLAPIVMLFVLPFVKREADHLPKLFWFWNNNISINGDGWARKREDGTWETIRVRGVPNCIP